MAAGMDERTSPAGDVCEGLQDDGSGICGICSYLSKPTQSNSDRARADLCVILIFSSSCQSGSSQSSLPISNVMKLWLESGSYTILYCTSLYCTIRYFSIIYYTRLYYTLLYYTILYYTIRTILLIMPRLEEDWQGSCQDHQSEQVAMEAREICCWLLVFKFQKSIWSNMVNGQSSFHS